MHPAAYCPLPAACCLLPACLLPAACCLLPAACCLLPAACCPSSRFDSQDYLLSGGYAQFAAARLLAASWLPLSRFLYFGTASKRIVFLTLRNTTFVQNQRGARFHYFRGRLPPNNFLKLPNIIVAQNCSVGFQSQILLNACLNVFLI